MLLIYSKGLIPTFSKSSFQIWVGCSKFTLFAMGSRIRLGAFVSVDDLGVIKDSFIEFAPVEQDRCFFALMNQIYRLSNIQLAKNLFSKSYMANVADYFNDCLATCLTKKKFLIEAVYGGRLRFVRTYQEGCYAPLRKSLLAYINLKGYVVNVGSPIRRQSVRAAFKFGLVPNLLVKICWISALCPVSRNGTGMTQTNLTQVDRLCGVKISHTWTGQMLKN
ncbi:MAG: hypothetical protein IPL83_07280 [Bdellovibrionales bacterium]|nr:hypothetical protein [Bdellovibrionales bacterium]